MKKEVLIALIIVLALPTVYAATVTQTAPTNSTTLTSPDILFTCNTPGPATSLALNVNTTGTFARNRTETGTGAISLSYTIYNVANGVHNWNCIATDAVGDTASANWTFTVNATSFSGTIPNQAFTVGQNTTPFDLDSYFTAATSYIVKGNSTIKVTIDNENMVTFSSTSAASETINFTSGTAVSNNIPVTATAAATNTTITCTSILSQTWSKNTNATINLLSYCSSSATINFTASTVPHIALQITNGVATLTPEKDWTGNGSVIFTAKSGSTTTNTSAVTLTVKEPAQTLKILSYLPAQQPQIPPGGMQAFQITKSGNGTITVSWYLDDQIVSGTTGDSYTYQGATEGTHTIKAVVSDGTQTASQNWTVTVAAQQEETVETPSLAQPEQETEVCGDGKCGGNENCKNCEKDCGCAANQVCENNQCAEKKTNKPLIITTAIMMALIVGGAIAYYLITQRPNIEKKEETRIENVEIKPPADITDFYEKINVPKEELKKPELPKEQPKPAKKENPVTKYIKEMRAKGNSDETIKKSLKSKGWKDQQITDALKEA